MKGEVIVSKFRFRLSICMLLLLIPVFVQAETPPSEAAETTSVKKEATPVTNNDHLGNQAGVKEPAEPAEAPSVAKNAHIEDKAGVKEPADTVAPGNTTPAEEEVVEEVSVADPLEPWNRLMYHFNDKLYFWVLKPVAKGYNAVVPEGARVSVSNFFHNVATPIRFVSSLLQGKVKSAGIELARFGVNTTFGFLGLLDPAKKDLNLLSQDEELGQTLGKYGMGNIFYIVWPFLGPSSVRDSIGEFGDGFLDPVNYISPTKAVLGIQAYERINDTSLHIGDYEDLKESAIDPYIAIRDAYIQHRQYKITK